MKRACSAVQRRAALWLILLSATLLVIGGASLLALLQPMLFARWLSINMTASPSPSRDAMAGPLVFIGFILLNGSVCAALGLRILLCGRVDRLLVRAMYMLFAIFVVSGVVAGGLSGHTMVRPGR